MSNIVKIKNVVKSDKSKQVNNGACLTSLNSGTYVKLDVATHSQYNSDVLMLQYTKDTKCQLETANNIGLFNGTQETLDITSFEVIGVNPMICNCITIQEIFSFYADGVIQDWYENFCNTHSNEQAITLARFLSAIGIEVWKDVSCFGAIYKGLYFVSNLGRVLSLNKTKQAKILKQDYNPNGYMYVHLWHNYQQKTITVHRLVALTFIGEPTEKMDACHSNTNKTDNRLFNLNFGTRSYNMQNPITLKKCKESAKSKATASTSATADKESTTE